MKYNMPFAEYRAIPAINASSIKAGAKSMRHMRYAMEHPTGDPTASMRWGKIVHLAILEPDTIGRTLQIWNGRPLKSGPNKGEITMDRKGPEWQAFVESCGGSDEWIVTPDEMGALMEMSAAVHGDREAHRLIEQTVHEQTVTWTGEMYGAAKGRLDGYDERGDGLVLDLKTTAQIEPRRFAGQFATLGYDMQIGWYCEGTGAKRASVIALESKPPYDVVVWRIPDAVIKSGREKAIEIARAYRCCEAANSWPGVAGGEVINMEMPAWACAETELMGFDE
jgi:hypothetical protein